MNLEPTGPQGEKASMRTTNKAEGPQSTVAIPYLKVEEIEGGYEASLPYREIVYQAGTENKAILNLIFGYADLARKGSWNPNNPEAKGVKPIQHTMSILSDHLAWNIERRREEIDSVESGAEDTHFPVTVQRYNEVIAAISTALAALGRIKSF